MKVIIKNPNDGLRFVEVENTLTQMQSLVGGYVQEVPLADGIYMLCDEDGMMKGYPITARVQGALGYLLGTGVFVRTSGTEWADCNPEDLATVREMLS